MDALGAPEDLIPGMDDEDEFISDEDNEEARIRYHHQWCVEWIKETELYKAVERRIEVGMTEAGYLPKRRPFLPVKQAIR